jgi:hypothetical protein
MYKINRVENNFYVKRGNLMNKKHINTYYIERAGGFIIFGIMLVDYIIHFNLIMIITCSLAILFWMFLCYIFRGKSLKFFK